MPFAPVTEPRTASPMLKVTRGSTRKVMACEPGSVSWMDTVAFVLLVTAVISIWRPM
jgi:hypothetical protein